MTTQINRGQVKNLIPSAMDFGARGDGLGTTPDDEGVDIMSAPWNTWDGNKLKTVGSGPFWEGVGSITFAPPTTTPFLNTDSWDRIGLQRMLWADDKAVYIPAGTYKVNLTVPGLYNSTLGRYYDPTDATGIGTSFTGLIMGPQQYKMVYGAGWYHTYILPKEDAAFFASATGHVNVPWAYSMLTLYKVNGLPTMFNNLSMICPVNWDKENENLAMSILNGCNGVTFDRVWYVGGEYGIMVKGSSSDIWISNSIFEQIDGAGIFSDATSMPIIDNNSWGSYNIGTVRQLAIDATGGDVVIRNNRIWILDSGVGSEGTRLGAVRAKSGLFTGNDIKSVGSGECCIFTGKMTVTGNRFNGASSSNAILRVQKEATVTGNNFFNETSGTHAVLLLGDDTASSATDIVVSGNSFYQTEAGGDPAILAPVTASTNYGAATASCLIDGNNFKGPALKSIGLASMGRNVFDGIVAADGARIITLANTATYDFEAGSGIIMVKNGTSSSGAIFFATGAAGGVTEMLDPGGVFSIVVGTAGTNVYYNGGTATYRLQNFTGASVAYEVNFVKMSSTI